MRWRWEKLSCKLMARQGGSFETQLAKHTIWAFLEDIMLVGPNRSGVWRKGLNRDLYFFHFHDYFRDCNLWFVHWQGLLTVGTWKINAIQKDQEGSSTKTCLQPHLFSHQGLLPNLPTLRKQTWVLQRQTDRTFLQKRCRKATFGMLKTICVKKVRIYIIRGAQIVTNMCAHMFIFASCER